MSTEIEQRLTDALRARAEQVQADDLSVPAHPEPVSRLRTTGPWLAAVAAVVTVILGASLTWGGGSPPRPDPAPVPTPLTPSPAPEQEPLRGDLDGDGRDDVATLDGNRLQVELATGEVLTARARGAGALLGIVDLEQEAGVAVAGRNGGGIGVWVVRDRLNSLQAESWVGLLTQGDGRRGWIDPDGALLDAAFVAGDPAPVTMAVRRWVAEGDVLKPVPQPMHCGDPTAEDPPTPCRDTPVGSDAELPNLRTPEGGMGIEEGALTPPGELLSIGPWTLTVEGAPEGDAAQHSNQRGELVMSGSGVQRRVTLPPGGVDGIVHVPDSGVVAVLQAREHGEYWTLTQVISRTAGADLVVLFEPEDTPIDGQWVGFFERTTWITEDGLFTRETIAEFGIHRLWRWEVADGALVPVELGRLCLDDNIHPSAYGAC